MRAAARGVLLESGFAGLWDFQDYPGARLRPANAHPYSYWRDFLLWRKARGGQETSCQNQDLRDYRIFRIILARLRPDKRLIHIRIGGIFCYGEKRRLGEIEILKIPLILKILILTKTRSQAPLPDDR